MFIGNLMSKYKHLHHDTNLPLGIFLIVLTWILFAIINAFVKVMSESLSTHAILFFQNFFAFLLFIPFICINPNVLKTKKPALVILRAILGVLTYYLLFFSVKMIPLVDAALLSNTAPLFIPFILLFWIKKKISKMQLLGIFVGFCGVILILKPGVEIFSFGSIIALLAGMCTAMVMATVRLLSSESPVTVIFYYMLISSLILFPFLWLEWQTPSTKLWLFLIISGILMYFTQIFFTQAFKYACATNLGPFSYTFVIVAGIIDWLVWGNVPTLFSFIGIILVILGGIITILFTTPRPTTNKQS